jgi:hypothetical protein
VRTSLGLAGALWLYWICSFDPHEAAWRLNGHQWDAPLLGGVVFFVWFASMGLVMLNVYGLVVLAARWLILALSSCERCDGSRGEQP